MIGKNMGIKDIVNVLSIIIIPIFAVFCWIVTSKSDRKA